MAKMGRPKVENPKNIEFKTSLDKDTLEVLKSLAEKLKVSRSEVVRRGIELVRKENLNK